MRFLSIGTAIVVAFGCPLSQARADTTEPVSTTPTSGGLAMARSVNSVASAPHLHYDSDALSRLALEAGLRDYNAKYDGKARISIRYDASGDARTSASIVRFDAESPDGKDRRSWRFDSVTGLRLD